MDLTRRTFLAGVGATGAATVVAAGPLPSPTDPGVDVDRLARTLTLRKKTGRRQFARVLRQHRIPHRWLRPDSVDLHGWTVEAPQLAEGFGWTTLSDDGQVVESWAELTVDSFDSDREYQVSVDDRTLETVDGRLHFRCENYPRVQLHDQQVRRPAKDHLGLLAQDGPVARCHRLVALA